MPTYASPPQEKEDKQDTVLFPVPVHLPQEYLDQHIHREYHQGYPYQLPGYPGYPGNSVGPYPGNPVGPYPGNSVGPYPGYPVGPYPGYPVGPYPAPLPAPVPLPQALLSNLLYSRNGLISMDALCRFLPAFAGVSFLWAYTLQSDFRDL